MNKHDLRVALQRVDPLSHNNFDDLLDELYRELEAARSAGGQEVAVACAYCGGAEKVPAQPEGDWVRCSERLPKMKDADCYGQVIGWDSDNKESVIGPPCDFKNAPWLTHWMATGLKDPVAPPSDREESGDE